MSGNDPRGKDMRRLSARSVISRELILLKDAQKIRDVLRRDICQAVADILAKDRPDLFSESGGIPEPGRDPNGDGVVHFDAVVLAMAEWQFLLDRIKLLERRVEELDLEAQDRKGVAMFDELLKKKGTG